MLEQRDFLRLKIEKEEEQQKRAQYEAIKALERQEAMKNDRIQRQQQDERNAKSAFDFAQKFAQVYSQELTQKPIHNVLSPQLDELPPVPLSLVCNCFCFWGVCVCVSFYFWNRFFS